MKTIDEIKDEYAEHLAYVFERDFKSWKEMLDTDFEIGSGICKIYSIEELMDQVAIRYASQFKAKLTSILHMSESKGVEGCTWGDTEMSSVDVAYGYNLALEYVKQSIGQLINKGK